mgnify:FL=1
MVVVCLHLIATLAGSGATARTRRSHPRYAVFKASHFQSSTYLQINCLDFIAPTTVATNVHSCCVLRATTSRHHGPRHEPTRSSRWCQRLHNTERRPLTAPPTTTTVTTVAINAWTNSGAHERTLGSTNFAVNEMNERTNFGTN